MTAMAGQGKVAAWYQAIRPRVFTASYAPLALAGVIALRDGAFNLGHFALALVGTMLLQTVSNLVNEWADHKRGADDLKQAGQSLTIKQQLLTPNEILGGAIIALVGACLIGLYLLWQTGPLLLLFGLGGIIVAVAYTAGPFPLAYHGLGEIAVGIFMGPMIVLGAFFVMAEAVNWALVWASLPIALMVAAILHANNIRDMEADRAANKRTLAVRLGRRGANGEYALLVGGAYIALVGLVLAGVVYAGALLALVTLPEALRLINIYYTSADVGEMHAAQGRTAKLHGQFGLLMAAGYAVHWLVLGWLAV